MTEPFANPVPDARASRTDLAADTSTAWLGANRARHALPLDPAAVAADLAALFLGAARTRLPFRACLDAGGAA